MSNYYFLTSLLPTLEVGHTPALHFEELKELLRDSLSVEDLGKFQAMRRFFDLENLRSFLQEIPLDPRGNLTTVAAIEEALAGATGFPDYVHEFMAEYDGKKEQLHHFPRLLSHYFRSEIAQAEGLLESYLIFEREWRMVMVGFRAKQLGRKVELELQYEDPSDLVTAQILAQKDAKYFEPPYGYEELKELFQEYKNEPLALHKAICNYRFKKIMELEHGELFGIDRILGYVARLMIVERWMELDRQEGEQLVESVASG